MISLLPCLLFRQVLYQQLHLCSSHFRSQNFGPVAPCDTSYVLCI